MTNRPTPGATARPSPNIWQHPDVYEIENRAADPDRLIEATIRSHVDWTGRTVLDLGCGTGFHLDRFAAEAAQVIGVEPHPPLAQAAQRRIRSSESSLGRVGVMCGLAQHLPLPAHSVDLVHARWAYFFGPGCEPGLAELERVVRPGGTAVIIDNDATRSSFGQWFRRQWPAYDPLAVQRFWRRRGWTRTPVTIRWEMATRADFEAVVRIEFSPELASALLAEHRGCRIDYAINVFHRRYGDPETT